MLSAKGCKKNVHISILALEIDQNEFENHSISNTNKNPILCISIKREGS